MAANHVAGKTSLSKETVREAADALGFSACGFAGTGKLEEYPRYMRWLETGCHAEMKYLESPRATQARQDPGVLLHEANTIIVLAASYPPALSKPSGSSGGRVASYAMGDDYHQLVSSRMWEFCAILNRMAGRTLHQKVYTDSGPLLERELGSRAGLGWVGKNSMLIHPQLGSYFFLGEVLTELVLEPDPPFATDRCGTCTACIHACPAGCILPDRTVDSRRCLSYLTIEHRGALPRDHRPALADWIFGCDVCQIVCPWNRFAVGRGWPEFIPRSHFPIADLGAELQLTESDFVRRFRNSALRRSRREGYLRNVMVAAGNSCSPDVIPPLARWLDDPDPLLRLHAVWALARIGGPEVVSLLVGRKEVERDAGVQEEIHIGLTGQTERGF